MFPVLFIVGAFVGGFVAVSGTVAIVKSISSQIKNYKVKATSTGANIENKQNKDK